jgi:hypothetical protein
VIAIFALSTMLPLVAYARDGVNSSSPKVMGLGAALESSYVAIDRIAARGYHEKDYKPDSTVQALNLHLADIGLLDYVRVVGVQHVDGGVELGLHFNVEPGSRDEFEHAYEDSMHCTVWEKLILSYSILSGRSMRSVSAAGPGTYYCRTLY